MLENGIFTLLFIWLIFLTYLTYTSRKRQQLLMQRSGKQHLDEILESLLEDDQRLQGEMEEVKKQLQSVIDQSKFYLQKVGFVRFSPFGKKDADQSFVLSFLDRKNNGIVVNFIYTADDVRIYTKRVKDGRGEEYELSEEEVKAVKTSR